MHYKKTVNTVLQVFYQFYVTQSMTKLTIDIPDDLHHAIKSYSSIRGVTIKEFMIEAATASLKGNKKITPKMKSKKSSKYITEKEADKLLKPYLLRLINRIEKGEEELYSWDEAKEKLKNS